MKTKAGLKKKLNLGFAVIGALVAIKIVEYFLGTRLHPGAWPYLAVLALGGAILVLYFFMHIGQLGRGEGEDDERD
jgi:hypothetical protein